MPLSPIMSCVDNKMRQTQEKNFLMQEHMAFLLVVKKAISQSIKVHLFH